MGQVISKQPGELDAAAMAAIPSLTASPVGYEDTHTDQKGIGRLLHLHLCHPHPTFSIEQRESRLPATTDPQKEGNQMRSAYGP